MRQSFYCIRLISLFLHLFFNNLQILTKSYTDTVHFLSRFLAGKKEEITMVILTKEKLILLNLNQGFFDFRKILFNL